MQGDSLCEGRLPLGDPEGRDPAPVLSISFRRMQSLVGRTASPEPACPLRHTPGLCRCLGDVYEPDALIKNEYCPDISTHPINNQIGRFGSGVEMSQLRSTKRCLCLLFLTHSSPQESNHLKFFSKDKHPSKSHRQASGKAASYQRTCLGISFEGRHRVPQPLMGRQRQQVWSPHDRPQAAGCGRGTSSIGPQAERQPWASRSHAARLKRALSSGLADF